MRKRERTRKRERVAEKTILRNEEKCEKEERDNERNAPWEEERPFWGGERRPLEGGEPGKRIKKE